MVTVTYLSTYLEPLRGLLLLFSRELSDMAGIIRYGTNLFIWHNVVIVVPGAQGFGEEVHDLYIQIWLNGDRHH